jgi:4,5-DOPA dioxygenase extradiol
MNIEKEIEKYTEVLKTSEKLPALFVGHGSPMNAIANNTFVDGFQNAANSIQTPQAILCISAHWFTPGTFLTGMQHPKTIHDFGGFPRELYQIEYPAPGNKDLAETTQQLLSPNPSIIDDSEWGLDHGSWSVLRHMYPEATIPVVQLSIDYTKPASYHFELAKQLRPLREKGVLIVGSGNIVHNLRMVDWKNVDKIDHGYEWASEAREIVNKAIISRNYQSLTDYKKLSTSLQLAIPTPDHFLPLLYVLSQENKNEPINLFNDHLVGGSLSMTSVQVGE